MLKFVIFGKKRLALIVLELFIQVFRGFVQEEDLTIILVHDEHALVEIVQQLFVGDAGYL